MVLDALFLRLLVTVDEAAELEGVLAAEDTADVLVELEAEAEDVLAELEAEGVLELGAALDVDDTVEL